MAISVQTNVQPQKKRGRPATGRGTPVQVRVQPELLARLDNFRKKRGNSFSRAEAFRRLVEVGLERGLK